MSGDNPNVLVDAAAKTRTVTADLLWALGFSLLTGLAAQVKIPLPYTPVPITLQTLAVLLSGALLGSRRGFLSQTLYLAEGAAGLPVFAGGTFSLAHLVGPTAGYLWSYPLAAALVGWMVERGASRRKLSLAVALVMGDFLILACGVIWVHWLLGTTFRKALALAFYPFLVGDIFKVALVGFSLPSILGRLRPRLEEPA